MRREKWYDYLTLRDLASSSFFSNRFEAPLKQIQKKIKKISKGFLKILFYIWNYTYGTHLYISHEQYLLNYIGKYTLTDFV